MSKRVANKKGQGSRNKCYANRLRKLNMAKDEAVSVLKRIKASEKASRKPITKPTFIQSFKNMFRRTQARA